MTLSNKLNILLIITQNLIVISVGKSIIMECTQKLQSVSAQSGYVFVHNTKAKVSSGNKQKYIVSRLYSLLKCHKTVQYKNEIKDLDMQNLYYNFFFGTYNEDLRPFSQHYLINDSQNDCTE